jgi:hypothetical protein
MRKVQEDAQAQQLALVAQRGVLEGQCRATTERIKQLEVSPGCSRSQQFQYCMQWAWPLWRLAVLLGCGVLFCLGDSRLPAAEVAAWHPLPGLLHALHVCLSLCPQSEVAGLQTNLAREQGTAQNATGRLAVLEASLAEQLVRLSVR